MAQNLLKIENVKKAYRKYSLLGKETSTFTALNGLNLSVEKGQIYGFLGPNGAGKTTTIKCIIGILEADSGDIFIDGKNIKGNELHFKNKIGFLPEQVGLYGRLTAKESLQFYGGFYDLGEDEIEKMGIKLALTQYQLPIDPDKVKCFDEFHEKYVKYVTAAQSIK